MHRSGSGLVLLAASAAIVLVPASAEGQETVRGRSELSSTSSGPGDHNALAAATARLSPAEVPVRPDAQPTSPGRISISIGPQTLSPGDPRYAARNEVAGTAVIVSFSRNPLREALPAGAWPSHLPISGRLTGSFGWRADPLHGSNRFHTGIDLAAPAGSPVMATSDGLVISAGWSGGYGYMVVLGHGNGMETRYAHLAAMAVEAGRPVRQGDIVGLVGSTGRSTGPHVHYEVRIDGRAVDPMPR